MQRDFTVLCVLALTYSTARPTIAAAKTFYVSPKGLDNWSGVLKAPNAGATDGPLATIAGARDAIRRLKSRGPLTSPVKLVISGGRYPLPSTFVLTPQDSGLASCPITYEAAPGQRPVFSGGRRITGWQKGTDDLWVADVPEVRAGDRYFHQLFVNGKRATRARHPNKGYLRTNGPIEPLRDRRAARGDSSKKMGFRFNPGDVQQWDGLDEANVFLYHSWTTSLHWVKEVDLEQNILRFVARSGWPVGYWERKQRYHLENYFEALDPPGEWYLDRKTGKLYYWPLNGENLSRADVIAPKLGILLQLNGEPELGLLIENVTFRGLAFQHADWIVEKTAVNDGQGAAFQRDAGVVLRGTRNITFERCEIAHIGMYALWLRRGAQQTKVIQCHIHDLGSGGVRIGETSSPRNLQQASDGNLIENSFIHDGGHVFPAGHGVWIGRASHNTVRRCEVCDFYYSGFGIGWSWGYAASSAHHNVVDHCHIHNLGKGVLSDMGAIYTLGLSPGTRLTSNVCHDIYSYSYGGWGLYNDEGSTDIVMENNIVYNTKTGGYHQHYGKENVLRNNVFAYSRAGQIIRSREEDHTSFIFERNIVLTDNGEPLGGRWKNGNYKMNQNLYWDISGDGAEWAGLLLEEWQAKGNDAQSLVADPLFVDAKSHDFRLRPGSPAYKLGFKDIDTSEVGLYGPSEWTALPKGIERPPVEYPAPKKSARSVNEDFEATAVGEPPTKCHLSYGGDSIMAVTDETAAQGKHSLKFGDAPGLANEWQPHLYYRVSIKRGLVRSSLYVRAEPGARMYLEWRDYRGQYKVGPNFAITPDGQFMSNRKPLLAIPHSEWIKVEIQCMVGPKKSGTFDMTVTVPGQPARERKGLPFGNPGFRRLTWVGFASTATDRQTFYVDDLRVNLVK